MNFQDIIRRILPIFTKDNITYAPYVNGGGDTDILNNKRSSRSDYDDTTVFYDKDGNPVYRYDSQGRRTIHGGVDIYYYKMVGDIPKYTGPDTYPNKNLPYVYAPVSGKVINRNLNAGGISILDRRGSRGQTCKLTFG